MLTKTTRIARTASAHGPRRCALAIALPAVAVLVAACGSSSSGGVAHVGTSTSAAAAGASTPAASGSAGSPSSAQATQEEKFSQCMRAHGVPNFPDPSGGKLILSPSSGINPASPAFQAASQACKKVQPAGLQSGSGAGSNIQLQSQALKFTSCMRSHGVPNFPEPSFSGGLLEMRGHGVDPNSPAFQSAMRACQSLEPAGLGG